ncbi:MAG: hypothetical protein ABI706_17795, partial [Ilumatobacteraceae bacterium]
GALVFGIAYAFTHRGSNRIGTDDWQPAQPTPASARGSATRDAGSGTQRAAGVQLAGVEGRQLLRNEVFIVGIFMTIAILVVFGFVWASDNLGAGNSWRYWLSLLPVFSLPFAGMTLVAMNLAALRARREGTEELFGSLPATSTTRVVGHLGSVWMGLVVQIVFVATTFASGRFLTDHFGAIDAASIGDVVVSFVLVACAGSLALALARWLPNPLAALAALVVLAVGGTAIGGIGGNHWSLTRQLSIWPRYPDHDWAFAVRPSWWHAAYLLSLGLVVAVVAVARQRRDRLTLLLGASAVALAGATGYAQTRPMTDGDAERIAAMISDPVALSSCRTTEGLTLCAYRDYADITRVWARELTAPFAAVWPHKRANGFAVVWQEPRLDRLDPAVRDRLDVAALAASRSADSATWNGVAADGTESNLINRLALGLWSVGLPSVPAGDAPCWAGGQARGVVALWVAAQGMSGDDAKRFVSGTWSGLGDDHGDSSVPAEWIDGYIWVGDATPPVLWSATDIVAAEAMLTLDATLVRDTLWADWQQWSDASATTGDLLTGLGVSPAGARSAIPSGLVACR